MLLQLALLLKEDKYPQMRKAHSLATSATNGHKT